MLTLICGLPRAGKTTYAERYDDVIHLDSCGYKGVLRKIEHKDGDVIVEGVYDTARRRKRLMDAYNGDGLKVIWLNTPTEVKKTRHGYCKRCEYPFEPPTLEEGWDIVITMSGE